ncbi:hypothetical protein LWI29_010922 [Acer saccharum]|uniref:Protein Lines C-terminal domain-containing protein n=1 Tax=Acer saccharum TaxID=4024 RepID=A0AA39W672_ACESA|nr:hypothetical protein LWI29_010922 [Acer saccharum]KAK1588705.1 hypothetical protein Q3G72_026222 [Acer saccharum]
MSRDSAYSRLYCLINDSICSYTEPEAVSLTKQQEKQLLASLSQVLRQIQLWTRELDCDSDDELKTHSKDHHYLSKLMVDLVFLLTVKSQYVQHLAGNILVVISEFLATSVLMIRLSFQSRLDCCITVSWLQLLHNYFQELLWQPIAQVESAGDDCLEGSPFVMSVSNGEIRNIHPHHVQRQAVFLLIRCSFILTSLREDTNKHCACATADSCLTFDSISDLDNCGQKRGLLELYQWIQGHLPIDTFLEYEMYMEKCINFSLSFLQLYMHEDDLLFKVLLQLLIIPFRGEQNFDKTKWTFQDVKEDVIFQVSNIFNPIHLFHLFLAELHYDHQMLLDYLISKDIGISCAEYLLRCLRLVCEHFHLFIEFSPGEKARNQSSDKKRKILDSSNFPGRLPSPTSRNFIQSLEDSDREYDYVHCITRGSHYKEAKDCLLSLKTSVENLCRKNLFLYNPEALLKRLTRFHELCVK